MATAPPVGRPAPPSTEAPTLTIIVNDQAEYPVWFGRLTARTASDLRQATGLKWTALVGRLFDSGPDGIDFDLIAALVWISRRQSGDSKLVFDEVAEAFLSSDKFEVRFPDEEPEPDSEDKTDPEASGAS